MTAAIDHIPCPFMMTDQSGRVISFNIAFKETLSGPEGGLACQNIQDVMTPASRIFMQTHVWPMLFNDGKFSEIYLTMRDQSGADVPVLANARIADFEGQLRTYWLFFPVGERSRFERELIEARNNAQSLSKKLAKSRNFITNVTNSLPGLVSYWSADFVCRFANETYDEWYGWPSSKMVGKHLTDFVGKRVQDEIMPYLENALGGRRQKFERTVLRPDGTTRHLLTDYVPDIGADGRVYGIYVLATDITHVKSVELDLHLKSQIIDHIGDAVMVLDASGVFLSVNASFSQLTGFDAAETIGFNVKSLKIFGTQGFVASFIDRDLSQTGRWQGETWFRCRDGSEICVELEMFTIGGDQAQTARCIGVFRDVTERWKRNQELKFMTRHDGLTGLMNRQALYENLETILLKSRKRKRQFAVMFLDLNGFKQINDRHGHKVGDDLLVVIANRLKGLLGKKHSISRLGGDEFVIAINGPATEFVVCDIARSLVRTIDEPVIIDDKRFQVGVSIGISLYPRDGMDIDALIAHADTAMYAAKGEEGSSFRFFGAVAEVPQTA